MLTHIAQRHSAQKRVADSVKKYVGIGMAQGTGTMRHQHTAQPQFTTFHQPVYVETETHPDHPVVVGFVSLVELEPRVNRSVFAKGLRCVFAMR